MNFNKILLGGNLTRNPEIRYAPSGTAIANFGIAINRNWTSDGEKKTEVCFVDIVAFAKRAEAIADFVKKGDPIFIEGRLKFEQWETKDGQKRNALKVVVENFQFLGSGDKKTVKKEENENPVNTGMRGVASTSDSEDIGNDEIPF